MDETLCAGKEILDAACGSRMFWFDKQNPHVLYCDNRRESRIENGKQVRRREIAPDIIADFRALPFPNETFWHVVFDPPHLTRNSPESIMGFIYGTLPREGWETYIKEGFDECWRVLRPCGTLVFKWSESDISTAKVLAAIEREPLYGDRSGRTGKTYWMCFVKT
jgi:SAM-dependent methyltransferase